MSTENTENTENSDILPGNDAEIREKNIATIREYVDARTDEERSRRWELYTEDCTSGAVAGEPVKGKELARKSTEWNMTYFPGFVFDDNIIFQSTDPNYFVVASKGRGEVNFPEHGGARPYENDFFHVFRMQDGKIKDYFEYSNAVKLYEALGLEMPELQSPGGWPDHTPEELAYDPFPEIEYSDPENPDVIDDSDRELREKNIAGLRKYVDARTLEERSTRWDLYVDSDETTSGAAGLPVSFGKAKARQSTEWNLVHFPEYIFNDNVVFQTQDPNLFMVMSNGTGGLYYPAYGERKTYDNVYFHIFRMQDGKILHYYEFVNSKFLYDTLGVELPEIRIPDGWPGEGV
ncbi:PhzA/PhzB family protein [Corynebacterium sp. USCH3]|uniref:PhzA/PhzB family protein n=1 Tax=Corynebacterium sp. USCH3 TaxID=3024840 RepID=UPI00309DB50E